MAGAGWRALAVDLVVDFATVLGLPSAQLCALTGLTLPLVIAERRPTVADAAELLWEVRPLTADWGQQVSEQADSIRQD